MERAGVGVGQQSRFGEHRSSSDSEIFERRCVAVFRQPVGGLGVAQFGSLAQGEQCFVAPGGGAGLGDGENVIEREVRRGETRRWLGERAIAACIATELGQWDEYLRRVRHSRSEARVAHASGTRHQFGERSGKEYVVGPLFGHSADHTRVSSVSTLTTFASHAP